MKTILPFFWLAFLGFQSPFVQAQSNYQVYIHNNLVPDGSTVYLSCSSGLESISAQYELSSNFYSMTIKISDLVSYPSGYTFSQQSDYQLGLTRNSSSGSGAFSWIGYDPAHSQSHIFTIYFVTTPAVSFVTPLPNLGVNQSGTLTVAIDQSINSYSTINYTTDHGLRVNGGFSASSGNTGNTNSVTLSDPSWGGNVYVNASNSCGTSPTLIYFTGTPYIAQQYFNGAPSGSSISTSNTSGDCSVSTDSHASSASWTQVGGSGSYSVNPSNPFICTVVPTNFIRMSVQVSNGAGAGESAIFMVTKSSFRAYSLPYPNPANDQLTINFEDAEYTDYMLNELALYDSNSQLVGQFDVEAAKTKKYFQTNKAVSFNVKNLKKGTYFLHVKMGDKLEANQIIIE